MDTPSRIDQATFNNLVKELLNNFYNIAALEAHPLLFSVFKPAAGYGGSRVEYLHGLVIETIEGLKPPNVPLNPTSPEWRPYLLLQKRYIEGMGLKELAMLLTVGDRQMRRDHHRALLALSRRLWTRLYPDHPIEVEGDELPAGEEDAEEPQPAPPVESFAVHQEQVDLNETVRSVIQILSHRARADAIELLTRYHESAPVVVTDRVILRQILISLINEPLSMQRDHAVLVTTDLAGEQAEVRVSFSPRPGVTQADLDERLRTARYWGTQVGAQLQTQPGVFSLRLPVYRQHSVLVIDDQLPVINLFRRILSQTNLTVAGATQAEEIFPMARQNRPALIILDVMMPQVDGWEILQMLKLNEETHQIPVVVCSAWAAPDLATSLGAAGFLKKPVTQKALFEALDRLGIGRG